MTVSESDIKILYVEDDPQARELLEKLLRLKYPQVRFITADNGDAGLKAFVEQHPDIVVTAGEQRHRDGKGDQKDGSRFPPHRG